MKMRIAVLAATLLVSAPLAAQSAAEHVALGNRDRDAMNAAGALRHYQEAARMEPTNVEALWRASREAIDLGEFNDAQRDSLYTVGEDFARRAVAADAKSAGKSAGIETASKSRQSRPICRTSSSKSLR